MVNVYSEYPIADIKLNEQLQLVSDELEIAFEQQKSYHAKHIPMVLIDRIKNLTRMQENLREMLSQPRIINKGELHMGDKITIKDVNGSVINIKTKLENVTQKITNIKNITDDQENELKSLLDELTSLLQTVPADRDAEAAKVIKGVDLLMEQAGQPNADKDMLEITGDGLKKAASNLADIVPDVLKTVTAIIGAIFAIHNMI